MSENGYVTKAERLEFMRRRFKSKESYPRVEPRPEPYKPRHFSFGSLSPYITPTEGVPCEWVYSPLKAKDPKALEPHRMARKSPLVKIAEHYFKKLRRR
jgi:hypothetical protein